METGNTSQNEFEYVEEQTKKEFVPERQQDSGFKINEHGVVSSITKLYAALMWFKKCFGEVNRDSDKITKFEVVDNVKGDFVQNYSQPNGRVTKFNICWVVKVTFKSVFGTPDERFYFVIFRKKFFNRWANTYYEGLNKYFGQDGITIKTDVLEKSRNFYSRNISHISSLVVVAGNTRVYYMPMKDLIQLSQKIGIITDKWNQVCVGIPKSLMSEEDVNKYN